jgi:hypothetical protein
VGEFFEVELGITGDDREEMLASLASIGVGE